MCAVVTQQNTSHFERFDSLNSLKGPVTLPSWSSAVDNYLEKTFGLVNQDEKQNTLDGETKLTRQGLHHGQTMLFHQWKKVSFSGQAMEVIDFRVDIYLHHFMKVLFRKSPFYLFKFVSSPVHPFPSHLRFVFPPKSHIFFSANKINKKRQSSLWLCQAFQHSTSMTVHNERESFST